MSPGQRWRALLLFTCLVVVLAGACVTPPPHAPEGDYYLLTDIYLRDAASYGSNVVGELYKGERVTRLEVGPAGWWQVRSGRTSQSGWVPGDLFSDKPVLVPIFFVSKTVNLRECPKDLCPTLQLLSQGDQVQKLAQNNQGWWRVLVARSRNIGWLPANTLAKTLEAAKSREKEYLYVATWRLKLLREPQVEAEMIQQLQLNDQVEKLDQNPAGWLKVRQPASGAVGWVQGRYLKPLLSGRPRPEKLKKKQPQAPKPTESVPQPEPEIM